MKRFVVAISCLITTLAMPGSIAASSSTIVPAQNEQETLMLFVRQSDDPVHIVQASFGADNALLDARLENKSHQKIQNYRLGWAAVKKDDVKLSRGETVEVPGTVDTSSAFDIPGQGNVAKDDLAKHPTGIVFYIAELQFQDGTRWQADVKKIKKEAAEMLK